MKTRSDSGTRRAQRRCGIAVAVLALMLAIHGESAAQANCSTPPTTIPGGDLLLLSTGSRLVQPIALPTNLAACSLGVQYPTYSFGTLDVVKWDPQSLAPDPTTVALRTRRFDPSSLQYFKLSYSFSPPVVTRQLPGIADGRSGPDALMVWQRSGSGSQSLQLRYAPAAEAWLPTVLTAVADTQSLVPPTGEHPVLAHSLCGGSTTIAQYRVVQGVMTTDQELGPSTDEFAQRFRVTEPVVMHWAEIANAVNADISSSWPVEVTLHAGQSESPPTDLSSPLTRGVTGETISPYAGSFDHARFLPTSDFDAQVTLLPGMDYWLVVRQSMRWSMLTRVRTGGESAAFDAAIGPLMRRVSDSEPWTEIPQRSLSFRLIGSLASVIDVPPTPSRQRGLRLRVHPSPSRGPVRLEWSGGRGDRVQIDVLDVSGRVLGALTDRGSASGAIEWDGTLPGGRRLGGGVYLMRARSGSALPVTQRVVLIR